MDTHSIPIDTIHAKVEKLKNDKGSRACYVCRQRKVKCDAAQTYPERCSNCKQFHVHSCVIPEPKKRKSKKLAEIMKDGKFLQLSASAEENNLPTSNSESHHGHQVHYPPFITQSLQEKYPEMNVMKLSPDVLSYEIGSFPKIAENADWNCPYTDDVMSAYIQRNLKDSTHIVTIDRIDYDYIVSAGCLLLPEESICWKWINSFFINRLPQLPIISKKKFVEEYNDLRNPPSLLLLYSVLYAGARFYSEKEWTNDQKDEQMERSDILYKRAKILFDRKVEHDTLCNLQSLMLLGSYKSRNKLDVRVDCAYIRQALDFCYCLKIHKNPDNLTDIDDDTKRLYKRIWWCLFASDTMYSFIMGRPWSVDCINKFDVPMITEMDLRDDIKDNRGDDSIETTYFIQRIKLILCIRKICESCSRIIHSPHKSFTVLSTYLDQCDQMMRDWIEQLPTSALFKIDSPTNNSFNAALSLEYYSALLLLHRIHIVLNTSMYDCKNYPSWGIVFKASHMVSVISRFIMKNKLVSFFQNIIPFSMNIAGLMMIYHLYNKDKRVHQIAQEDIEIFLSLLYEASVDWPSTHITYYTLKSLYESKEKQAAYVKYLLTHHCKYFRNPAAALTDDKAGNEEIDANTTTELKPPIKMQSSAPIGVDSEMEKKIPVTEAPANSIMYRPSGRIPEMMGYNPVSRPGRLSFRDITPQSSSNLLNVASHQTPYGFNKSPAQHPLRQDGVYGSNPVESPKKDLTYPPSLSEFGGIYSGQNRSFHPVAETHDTKSSNLLGRYNYVNSGQVGSNTQKLSPSLPNALITGTNGYDGNSTGVAFLSHSENLQPNLHNSPFISPMMTPLNGSQYMTGYSKNYNNQNIVSDKFDLVMPPDAVPGFISTNWQPEFDTSSLNYQNTNTQNPSSDFDLLFKEFRF